eukprot:CAMPEP_0173433868 /NCGR_PEP_ID=MMETSP1357-20121228/11151_1 /TAXON_ID=77926 /ORGANISM="Hemiselmis rufescens, Strain PCC563" /LENGTH=87 /DNA_ID=CAMNT_0014398613 /DNA_START=248 /DNA_END=507 /DNA_ORIENTATION=-
MSLLSFDSFESSDASSCFSSALWYPKTVLSIPLRAPVLTPCFFTTFLGTALGRGESQSAVRQDDVGRASKKLFKSLWAFPTSSCLTA